MRPKEIDDLAETLLTERWGKIKTWMQTSSLNTAVRLPLHPDLGDINTPYPPEMPTTFPVSYSKPESNGDLQHCAIGFVHGGLDPNYKYLTPFPKMINELSDSLVAKSPNKALNLVQGPTNDLDKLTPDEVTLLRSHLSPLWYREWEKEKYPCSDIDKVLAKTGTRMMIVGHTATSDRVS